ncbi:pilus assembly protein [Phenylobacterium sp. LjRoot225]|uniref:TadE/TadG family type IV pilus assembly protein n=1 Tax=Phenylobacterium sp. LjRoot225 TaxID=3342285 RepID=UPI003ECE1DB4
MRSLRRMLRDERGATLVETTIIFPLVLILTFGLVEFGNAFWQYHAAEKATAVGARWLSTRHGVRGTAALTNELYTAPVPDCFVNSGDTPGTACSQVAGATAWSQTCSGSGGGSCSSTVMADLLAQMQAYAPFITAANVNVQLRGSTMGFVGRGRAVPLITVRTTGLTYNFITLDALLGLGPLTMPGFASTFVAEDQKEGPGI